MPWALLGSLYMTQALSLGFFFVALAAILRSGGASLAQLGLISALGLMWALKVLWAPLVDRWAWGRLGHERGWVIAMQGAMLLTLLALMRFDPLADFAVVYALSLLLSVLAATQDVATDALACRLLPAGQRGLGNAVQVGGGLAGHMLGGGVVLMLYPLVGWAGALALVSAGVALSLIQALAWHEPGHARAPAPPFSWRLWIAPGGGRWWALLALSGVGLGVTWALVTPLLVDAGWSLERIGLVMNGVGPLVGVGAAAGTGLLIRAWGRGPVLGLMAAGQGVVLLGLLAATTPAFAEPAFLVVLPLLFVLYGIQMTVLYTVMMDHAGSDAPGAAMTSQYALHYLFTTLWGWGGLQVADHAGFPMAVGAALALAGLFAALLPVLLARPPSPLIPETLE
ncbi:MFS transporter [Pararhodospirillum oryzae]|uniref:MFS transporter n=1 Tax=Pararhodospirillum oryzae TaxID=478448 RepID=A0A512H333_9PROT|nr:MFS transporter [Pararhodospirillum oryzae]